MKVVAYKLQSPFAEWLKKLPDRRSRARILVRLNRVRLGNFGDCKLIGKGIFELRMDFGPGYRISFGRKGKTMVLLRCGGDKRTQSKDIQRAQRYGADYGEREHE